MMLSEQAVRALITPLLKFIPEESVKRAAEFVQIAPEEFYLLKARLERIEQNQAAIMRHLGVDSSPTFAPGALEGKQDAA